MAKQHPDRAVIALLEEAGAVIDEVRRKKHSIIKWTHKGQKMVTSVSRTPSDPRSVANSVAGARRQLREAEQRNADS